MRPEIHWKRVTWEENDAHENDNVETGDWVYEHITSEKIAWNNQGKVEGCDSLQVLIKNGVQTARVHSSRVRVSKHSSDFRGEAIKFVWHWNDRDWCGRPYLIFIVLKIWIMKDIKITSGIRGNIDGRKWTENERRRIDSESR